MHKFQPRVYLVRRKDGESSSVSDIEREEFRSFVFPETQFTAVTAYQNQLVSIKSNTKQKREDRVLMVLLYYRIKI